MTSDGANFRRSPRPYTGRRRPVLGVESLEPRRLLIATPLITELMADNISVLQSAATGRFEDWIEIYNPGPESVDLMGWYLTDRKSELHGWQFPASVVLDEGDFLVVFASGEDLGPDPATGEFHTNFALGRNGEYLALVRPDGTTVASEYEPEYPPLEPNMSYGLTSDFTDTTFFSIPTPGARNPVQFDDGVFHPTGGVFDGTFRVELQTFDVGPDIHYTLDGSIPTAADPEYETGSPERIELRSSAVVRARSLANSTVYTQTYVIPGNMQSDEYIPATFPDVWTDSGGNQTPADYRFNMAVAPGNAGESLVTQSMRALPNVMLTMPPEQFFDPQFGIYTNPMQSGDAWERSAYLEIYLPETDERIEAGTGVEIRGDADRDPVNTPKHSFRLNFKDQYGPNELEGNFFPSSPVDQYDRLELNAEYGDSWLDPERSSQNEATLIREQWVRETHRAMGQPVAEGRLVHLHLNGVYWGVYTLRERLDEGYAEIHFGGGKSDYDVIDAGVLQSGSPNAWNELTALVSSNVTDDAWYGQVQQYVDLESFIDLALLKLASGDRAWGDGGWVAIRNREASGKFRFWIDRGSHTLREFDDPLFSDQEDEFTRLFGALRTNSQFRRAMRDRLQYHLQPGGALTVDRSIARWNDVVNQAGPAMLLESGRWGDYRQNVVPGTGGESPEYLYGEHWTASTDHIAAEFLPQRIDYVVTELQGIDLASALPPVEFDQYGGAYEQGFRLSMSSTASTILFTTDGADPVSIDGAISPSAHEYTTPLALDGQVIVKARSLVDGQPGPLTVAAFFPTNPLQISEIQFHGELDVTAGATSDDDLDFIELYNTSSETIDLAGVAITDGVTFEFATSTVQQLLPGQRVLVVANQQVFANKYDTTGLLIAGEYDGRLANSGERIEVRGGLGQLLTLVSMDDGWYEITDGDGFSLVRRVDFQNVVDASDPELWRPSFYLGGSPGHVDPGPNPGDIIISEALTHSDELVEDWIELHNTTTEDIDIGGWYWSDQRRQLQITTIPDGTILPAGGYLVFAQQPPADAPEFGGVIDFAASKLGEKIYLSSRDRTDEPGGYRLVAEFTYGFNSSSFNYHRNSSGQVEYVASLVRTRGLPNSDPAVDRIRNYDVIFLEPVISEILYAPPEGGDEFIELYNPHSVATRLDEPYAPSWRFTAGVVYNFPDGVEIPARSYALVVPIDPEEFRLKYDVPAETQIFGPYSGELSDSGELLRVSRAAESSAFVPFSMSDQVFYNDGVSTWPDEARTQGASLVRVSDRAYGNEVTNWMAGNVGGTPGRANQTWAPTSRVVDRMLFYNGSAFDESPMIDERDIDAIAADRFALRPGQRASITNYSNFDRGINGIMVDLLNAPGTPTLSDFSFRVGNTASPRTWRSAPEPLQFSVWPGRGSAGADRFVMVWADHALKNTWLEVTVHATDRTGLTSPDVHYWGSVVGDVGNSLTDTIVDSADVRFIETNQLSSLDVTNRFDLNRDGEVDDTDIAIATDNQTNATTAPIILDLRADFDGDRITGPRDVALLSAEAGVFDPDLRFDLTGDSRVDDEDVRYVFDRITTWLPGDTNQDRRVDSADIATVLINMWRQPSTRAAGDFNGDGTTDGRDVHVWWAHRFLAVPPVQAAATAPSRVPRAAAPAAECDAAMAEVIRPRRLLADRPSSLWYDVDPFWASIARRRSDFTRYLTEE